MKAIIFLTLMVSSIFAYSQNYDQFYAKNEIEARKLSDSIASNAKRHFIFKEVKHPLKDTTTYIVSYVDNSDSNNIIKMNVIFDIDMVGANKNLEIRGTRVFKFKSVSGKYIDLFSFWKKFINQNADLNAVSSKNRDEINVTLSDKTQLHFYFHHPDEKWTIRIL